MIQWLLWYFENWPKSLLLLAVGVAIGWGFEALRDRFA